MKLNNLDLNKIKCFQSVAEYGGLQIGAKKLNLTTSAVYQSIKKLEEDLKVHLFYRSGKKYVLTDDGKKLLEIYRHFNWNLEQFLEQREDEAQLLEGEIKVGLPLNFSKTVFIPIMKKFSEAHPHVQFILTIAETQGLLSGIEKFELHFAVTDDFQTNQYDNKIVKKKIFNEELVLVSSKEFYKEHHKSIDDIKELKNLTHLCYATNLPIIQKWYHLTYKKQVKINHFHVIDNVETMLLAIKASLGVAVVPRDLILNRLDKNEFHIIQHNQNKNQILQNPIFLVQEANYIPNHLCKRFLDFFLSEI